MPDDVARSDAVTMFLPSIEANLHHLPIVAWPRQLAALEIKLAFAVIGEKQEDVPTRPIAHGATLMMLVAPEKGKARAKAKAKERAKARKEKVKARAKVKEKDKRVRRQIWITHARRRSIIEKRFACW